VHRINGIKCKNGTDEDRRSEGRRQARDETQESEVRQTRVDDRER